MYTIGRMIAQRIRREEGVHPAWKSIFRAGRVCFIISGLLFLVFLSILLSEGAPPATVADQLTQISNNTLSFEASFLVWSIAFFLLIPAMMGMYGALRGVNRKYALVAMAFVAATIASFVVYVGYIFGLVSLAAEYVSSSGSSQSAALTAAQNIFSVAGTASMLVIAFLSVAIIISSYVMYRGRYMAFPLLLFSLGVGIIGIVGGFVQVDLSLIVPTLIAFWLLLAGFLLMRRG